LENAVPLRTRIESAAHAPAEMIAQSSLLMKKSSWCPDEQFLSTARYRRIPEDSKSDVHGLSFVSCTRRFANIC
jgi:hypothetical protein